jgi:methyltransferase (TIGR00027 family)
MATPQDRTRVRSDNDEWDIVSSVGYTALLVAALRALHAVSAEPLVRDEYAKHFITASADPYLTGLLTDPETSECTSVFARLYGLQTRFFDDFFLSAADGGIRQVVIVAAGLDSRAYRLKWPSGITVFEVDRPKVLEFKMHVLVGHSAEPTTERKYVAADLRNDWSIPLRAAGFDPQQATAWSAEGVLPYLSGDAQNSLFTRIDQLSASGSRLAIGALGSRLNKVQVSALEATHPGLDLSGEVDFSPLTYDDEDKTSPEVWLAEHRWAVDAVRSALDLQADYGLISSDMDAQIDTILCSQYVTATR